MSNTWGTAATTTTTTTSHSHVQGQHGHCHKNNFGHGHLFKHQWASAALYAQHSHHSPAAIFPGQSGSDSVHLSDAQVLSTNVDSELSLVIHIGPHNKASLSLHLRVE